MSLFEDPTVGQVPEPTWSVTELADRIGNAVRAAFRDEVWVRGEIRDLSRAKSGHVYFTLTDPDEGTQACLDVMLSDRNRGAVNAALIRAGGGVRMTDGTEVRIRGRLDWYSPRGQLQLRMTAIDPAYTLGQLEAARAELLARLKAEGLLEANAAVPMPLVPLRIGLVTSSGSAAEADFVDTLRRSGFAFEVVRFDVRVQGHDAPLDLVGGIQAASGAEVDVVALVRGGGARTDLQAYDDERVARAIAACPAPVLTGVGHETDRSIADEMAHRAEKTPTACANALVTLVAAYWADVAGCWAAIAAAAERAVGHHERHVEVLAARAGRSAGNGLQAARHRLDGRTDRVRLAARGHLRDAHLRAADQARRLGHRAPRVLAEAQRSVSSLEAPVRALDPVRPLARGWSITRRADGAVIREPADVTAGDELRTLVAGGELRSTVVATSTVDPDA